MTRHPLKGSTGWSRIVKTLHYSWQGLQAAWTHEVAFRYEVAIALLLIPLAIFWGKNWLEYVVLLGVICLLLIVELLNSAIEAAVDHTSLELNPLAKRAKDIASAAVFLTLLLCGGIWLGVACRWLLSD